MDSIPPLHKAARDGALRKAKKLLAENRALLSSADVNGITPLYEAAQWGQREMAEFLLQNGAEINVRANNGKTPLNAAALYGHTEVVKFLLERGADVNAKDNEGMTPLHAAAYGDRPDAAAELLSANAEIEARSNGGGTPLHTAAAKGYIDMAELLILNHADIDAAAPGGATPLDLAALNDRADMVRFLLAKHAKAGPETLRGHSNPEELLHPEIERATAALLEKAELPFASSVDYARNLQDIPDDNLLRSIVIDKAIWGAVASLFAWGVINLGAWYFLSDSQNSTLRELQASAPPGTFDIFIYGGLVIGGVMLLFGLLGMALRNRLVGWLNGIALIGLGIWNLTHDAMLNNAVQPYGHSVGDTSPIWYILGIAQIGWGVKEIYRFSTLGPKPVGIARDEKKAARAKLSLALKASARPESGRLKFILTTSQGIPFGSQKTEHFTMWLLPDRAFCLENGFGQYFEIERASLRGKRFSSGTLNAKGKKVVPPIEAADKTGKVRKLPLDSASVEAVNEWLRLG